MNDIVKLILGIIVAALVISILFGFLFKVGIILLIGLGVLYLFKRVFGSSNGGSRHYLDK